MRVAFVGKGGSGKSLIVGTSARVLGASGEQVLTLDSDRPGAGRAWDKVVSQPARLVRDLAGGPGRQAGSLAVSNITKAATSAGSQAGRGGSGRSRCAIATSGLVGINGVQQLDGDRPRQDGIGGSPHLAEPAGADLLTKPVTTIQERRGSGHQHPLPLVAGL